MYVSMCVCVQGPGGVHGARLLGEGPPGDHQQPGRGRGAGGGRGGARDHHREPGR